MANRISWNDLPAHLQRWAETVLGSPVVRVEHATGGYSPGTTDALFCANDTAGFLKAVHPSINPHSPALLRAERHVTAQLPAAAPVAQLIDAFDEGPDGWVALMLQYVEGHQPPLPWTNDAIAAVLDDLTAFSASVTPSPVTGLKGAGTELAHLVGNWPELGTVNDLDPWLAARTEQLHRAAQHALVLVEGETLTHLDLRADNLLLRADGSMVIVDWPWAVTAAPWLDPALLLIEFISSGAPDVDADRWIDRLADVHTVTPETLAGLLIGMLSFFESVGRQPDPPGLPTVRAFQRFQADALRRWVRESRHTSWLR